MCDITRINGDTVSPQFSVDISIWIGVLIPDITRINGDKSSFFIGNMRIQASMMLLPSPMVPLRCDPQLADPEIVPLSLVFCSAKILLFF